MYLRYFFLYLSTSIAIVGCHSSPGKISGGVIETISIPASGTEVFTQNIYSSSKGIKVKIQGVFKFNSSLYADAEYRMDYGGNFTEKHDNVSINGSDKNPVYSDRSNHIYEYDLVGNNGRISLRILDNLYGDNSGALTVDIYYLKNKPIKKIYFTFWYILIALIGLIILTFSWSFIGRTLFQFLVVLEIGINKCNQTDTWKFVKLHANSLKARDKNYYSTALTILILWPLIMPFLYLIYVMILGFSFANYLYNK